MSPRLLIPQRQYDHTLGLDLTRQLAGRDRDVDSELRRLRTTAEDSAGKLAAIWVYPEDHGAKRDGKTDDTRALQRAIVAAEVFGGTVWLSAGVYRITRPLLLSGTCAIDGPTAAVVLMTGDNLSALFLRSSVESIRLHGWTLRGNNTGLGGLTTGVAGGHGIVLNAASGVEIDHMTFENIGINEPDPTVDVWGSPIAGVDTGNVLVTNCYFAPTCHNHTGADILLAGQNTRIEGNVSESFCDAFASLGGDVDNIRHIVRNNFATRTEAAISRSGVLAAYAADSPTFADISHNHIEGFKWHGIYTNADLGSDSGAAIMAHNTIRHCGGMDNVTVDPPVPWPGAGIKSYGHGGVVMVGNNIYGCGYSSEFVARDTVAPGIIVLGNTSNQTISENLVRRCSGNGITLSSLGSTADDVIENITIGHNVIDANDVHGIEVAATTTNLGTVTDITVIGNVIRVAGDEVHALYGSAANGGWFNRVDFIGNLCVNTDPVSSNFDSIGIRRSGYDTDYTRYTGKVIGNTVIGFRVGIRIAYGTPANLFVPNAVLVDGNRIEDCNRGYMLGNEANAWGIFVNGTGWVSGTSAVMGHSRSQPGNILGSAADGTVRIEMLRDAIPADGVWPEGCRMRRITLTDTLPRPIAYQNVATGTPGTWQTLVEAIASGTGSPEGVLTATVGALYVRTDGGAGTTLYVKESGTGNTGWVGK